MNWEMFYLICFGLGLGLSILTLAGGSHHHFHVGHHGTSHLHTGTHRGAASPINGFTLTAFLCWFGGSGYLLARYGGLLAPVVLMLSTVIGLFGGTLIFWFLARVLLPHEKVLTAEDTDMVGVIGRVSSLIREDGTGEIIFSQNGARRSSPARSDGGKPIPREAEVVVLRYERGVAFVRSWDEISNDVTLLTGESHRTEQASFPPNVKSV